MTEERDRWLHHSQQMRDDLLSALQRFSDELRTERLLDGWSVKDHLAHGAHRDDIRASLQ